MNFDVLINFDVKKKVTEICILKHSNLAFVNVPRNVHLP